MYAFIKLQKNNNPKYMYMLALGWPYQAIAIALYATCKSRRSIQNICV